MHDEATDTHGPAVTLELHGAVALITLARPAKRNALSRELRVALADAFARAGHDDAVACLVLTGAGGTFCAGLDREDLFGTAPTSPADVAPLSYAAISDCRKPVIAAINGPALAGGFALALHCDMRIAADTAELGFLGHGKGIPPSYAAARAVLAPGVARDLCVTGRIVSAQDALRLGVVSEVTAAAEVVGRALEVAQEVASGPPHVVREAKRRFLIDQEASIRPLMEREERFLLGMLERVLPDFKL